MDNEASFSISVQDGRVEVTGSESFVREQISEFKDVIREAVKALGQIPPTAPPTSTSPQHQHATPPAQHISGSNPYPNVIALEDDGIKILKSLPGSNKATKTRNAALLVLLGNKLKGENSALTKDIRKACQDHACLDSGNFAAHLKAGKEHFIISGKAGGTQSAKLSHPGEV